MSNDDMKPTLPKADDVKRSISVASDAEKSAQSAFNEKFKDRTAHEQTEYHGLKLRQENAHLSGLIDHYKHKKRWSTFLGFLLFCMIVFQFYLLRQVGMGIWDFTQYKWLLPTLLVQNLGQIIGLAYVVVKSLFKDQ